MTYVALLRGIMPTNPNMKGEHLRRVFESLGFSNVATVIASGNVIFESDNTDTEKLEDQIEDTLFKKLGFRSPTIIRSKDELEKLVKRNPFKDIKDEKPNYLIVTFFKNRQKELCQVIDLDANKNASFMTTIKKDHGKALTTRTWKTVGRILKKMSSE
jgi:uncharacterized protein (DUF1697 family)